MAEIHHFTHGGLTPTVSYVLSVLGSLLGLICAVRLRNARSTAGRVWWLALASLALGGTGIWTMHFVAMIGFGVTGTPIRYDVGRTAASAVIAVAAVAVGLSIVALVEKAGTVRIVAGGVIAGLGVGAMHYTGMSAMRLNGDIEYGTGLVVASMVIAVVAATVALWLAITVRRTSAVIGAALVMGIAVNGMHFTGMLAMSVRQQTGGTFSTPDGASASSLLIPIGVGVVFGALGLGYALAAAPTDEDRAAAAYLAARLQERPGAAQAQTPPVVPAQRGPGRAPSLGGSWTYRDRSSE